MQFWKKYNGQQSGDPAKLAKELITISNKKNPLRRFIAGADAIESAEQSQKHCSNKQMRIEVYQHPLLSTTAKPI